MIIKKKPAKNKDVCKVTFKVPRQASMGAQSIALVGDFNNWSTHDTLMKKLKSGEFKLELDLEANREYQFRYLIDDSIWENDWDADKYVRSDYGNCDNSVIIV